MRKKGISLLVLIITIIVIVILAGAVILALVNGGVLEKSKQAKFMNDYTAVQDGVSLYYFSKYNAATGEFELPLKGYLTAADKTEIKNNVPTLNTKIEELSGPIDSANLAWIDSDKIGVTLSAEKQAKGYIIDVITKQIYDYVGDVFESKRWHTLDGGVALNGTTPIEVSEELWDGWIKLTLFYPAGSTEKKWRIGTEGELRADPMLMWQDYTGPITIPLDRVKDVWIKYVIDNKEVIIPPAGTLLVDISPDKTGGITVSKTITDVESNAVTEPVTQVNVNINFDETATVKEYRVGDSGWMTYTGPFTVTENCIIEARAKKIETIYNTDGTILTTRDIVGKDLVYIGKMQIQEEQLAAPTITRLPAVGSEKARVQITYPVGADKKIYKVNYGTEENYANVINVTNYGTYIIAYYYDAAGKRSQAASILINDTTTGTPVLPPSPYDPDPPYIEGDPVPVLPPVDIPVAPTINVSPTTLIDSATVSIAAPANADKVYIKLGRYAEYQEYISGIIVRQNTEVYAYYRTYEGEKSNTASRTISNIKQPNKPYVYINANPYPWGGSYGANKVTVTIQYSDTNTIEYSEDGIVYQPYNAPFDVTENKVIYARGTNLNGVTETSLNINNIGSLAPTTPTQNLSVGINVNPEPTLSSNRVAKATVTIDYDTRATEKYYSIGRYGILNTYTGAFDVTSNCTIYAYAKGTNARGQTAKTIDNISTGISEPVIIAVPNNSKQSSKVSITIEYDKYATMKRYSINGGTIRDYTAPFDIEENGTTVYAYSENALGQKSEASYRVENIVPDPPILALDKGNYYLLKLNYPPTSKGREYKWKENGEWKEYKDAGILLIKPQFKDQLIQNGTLVKIEDETGKLVTFTGDYYLMDVSISELFENLFMRWDREPLPAPQILINPIEPTKQVTATISYPSAIVKKQYKLIQPGELSADWQDYTAPITIDRNNTIIYAKGMDETEVWSAEGMKKVTNIDETPPVIKLTADLITAQQKVSVKVGVTDDVGVGKVKWASGSQGESYFATGGTEIVNDGVVNITSNGYYTFYGEDKVGNKQVYTLNITNVDLTPPVIDIAVSPETTVGLTSTVTINYGDSTTKQYKIGESNATWTNYTTSFNISSYTILSNNWQNADGTVTIYAKGKDVSNNEITVQKKIVSLDLDKPSNPVIQSNSGYAVLASYGVILDATTTITYDTRTDIDNYYSIDSGTTWLPYTGQFNMPSGSVIAKSVKKSTGLEVTVSKTIAMPADALKTAAYDKNDTTYIRGVTNQLMLVDSSMQGKSIRVKWGPAGEYRTAYIHFLDSNNNIISSVSTYHYTATNTTYTMPIGTKWIKYVDGGLGCYLYEIEPASEPTFSSVNGYMLLHADPTKAIKQPYQMVTINYFPTSVQRLYRIGATGNWLNYVDQPVKLNNGDTVYAKGIDQYGNETRIISSYTSSVADALKKEVYDKNDTTYVRGVTNQLMEVDSSMQGKIIRVKWGPAGEYRTAYIHFLDSNNNIISSISTYHYTATNTTYTIPTGTKWMKYVDGGLGCYLYEIEPANEPVFSSTNGYMLLHSDITKAIRAPYQNVTISYFPSSVQKLYRIGATGEWLNYANTPIKVIQGETVYAKGIDQYGFETRIVSSYTANVLDALKKEVYDGDYNTNVRSVTNQYMEVDSSMHGKTIRVKWGAAGEYKTTYIYFLDSNNNTISSISTYHYTLTNTTYTLPVGTKWIKYVDSGLQCTLYEIQYIE